jgi:hypothetical protein
MRNKSYDINARKMFAMDAAGTNQLDNFGKYFTRLISLLEEIISSYGKLKLTAVELKKMAENFVYAERIIDRNLWDRKLKPEHERKEYKSVEVSISQDRVVFKEQKDAAYKAVRDADSLLKYFFAGLLTIKFRLNLNKTLFTVPLKSSSFKIWKTCLKRLG